MIHGVMRPPGEVLFGCGARAALPAIVSRFGKAAFVCSDEGVLSQPAVAQTVEALRRAGITATIFGDTAPELPLHSVSRALQRTREMPQLDVVIGLGGGSAIDLAKIVSLLLTHGEPLARFYGESLVPGPCTPVIAVPTTAGTGSEVTPVGVISDPGRELKVGVSSQFLVPAAAICDPELTTTCPPKVTAYSGIDALAHAVEAFTAARRLRSFERLNDEVFHGKNELSDGFALAAVRRIARTLERAVADGSDLEARESMLLGSLYAGLAFAAAGTAGAHALQYAVGAATETPHGLGVGLLLPFVLSFTRPACETELESLSAALGVVDGATDPAGAAIEEVRRLALAVGVPPTLAGIGVGRADLPRIAEQASGVTRLLRNSPRILDPVALLSILEAAHDGLLPDGHRAEASAS